MNYDRSVSCARIGIGGPGGKRGSVSEGGLIGYIMSVLKFSKSFFVGIEEDYPFLSFPLILPFFFLSFSLLLC